MPKSVLDFNKRKKEDNLPQQTSLRLEQVAISNSHAIHGNIDGEINALTEESSPASNDLVMIEDESDSYSKKKVQLSNLPGGGVSALDDLTDVTITSPTQGDILHRGASVWENLALGTETYVLKAGASDVAWGQVAWGEITSKPSEFTPSAHAIDIASGYHTGSLPLTDLASYGAGRLIYGGVSDWDYLAGGTENYVLKMGATYPAWGQVGWTEVTGKPSTFTPSAHAIDIASGYHTGSLPLTDIASYSAGRIIYGGASDWDYLGLGTENFYLKAGATYPEWEALDISEDTTPTLGGALDCNELAINDAGKITSIEGDNVTGLGAGVSLELGKQSYANNGNIKLIGIQASCYSLIRMQTDSLMIDNVGGAIYFGFANATQTHFYAQLNMHGAGIDMNSQQINDMADPSLDQDAATKKYVDDAIVSPELDDLTDVTITGPADDDILQYDNGSSQWVDRSFAEADIQAASSTAADARAAINDVIGSDGHLNATLDGDHNDLTDLGNVHIGNGTYDVDRSLTIQNYSTNSKWCWVELQNAAGTSGYRIKLESDDLKFQRQSAGGGWNTFFSCPSYTSNLVGLANGTTIDEFSIDGDLTDNSDNAVPTEKAVKTYVDNNTGAGTDTDAIHDNVANEITAITEKTTLVANDEFIIEDSGASNVKKSAKVSAIRVTESQITDLDHDDTDAIHDNIANEITAITEKTTLVANDEFLIEDYDASGVKKSAKISAIRITESQISDLGSYVTASGAITAVEGESTLALSGIVSIAGTTKTAGNFYAGTSDPTNTNRLNYDGYLYATRFYNAIYNDYADFFQRAPNTKKIAGKCYSYIKGKGLSITKNRADKATIGICSDTYAYGIGDIKRGIPISVGGFVLAYCDKEYDTGDLLVSNETGVLTLATKEEIIMQRSVAKYMEKETKIMTRGVKVKGRHWVEVL